MIPFVVDALGTIPKRLVKRLEEFEMRRIESFQTAAFLRTRILRSVLETCSLSLSLSLSESCKRPFVHAGAKKLANNNNDDNKYYNVCSS